MAYRFRARGATYGWKAVALAVVAGYPVEAQVLDGVFFGTSGTEYEGTLDIAAAEAAAAAAQKATDAAFLETNKDEIIAADTDILGEFGVTGTATAGGGGGVRRGGALRGA